MASPRQPRRLGATDTSGVALGAIQFARDGDTLVGVGGDRVLRLWDASDPRKPRLVSKRPTGHTEAVCSVAVHRDGVAATSSYDDTARLCDLSDPAPPAYSTRSPGTTAT
ncbi:WD40 repeat domain-containing protein [Streptomyces sp. NPDC008159]|uniref:WD40 repeat domain-containing protein n=1 Tax=Streptomyces sp. NPDC008159 TaxID=3364817 RepID=UPI0036EC67AF